MLLYISYHFTPFLFLYIYIHYAGGTLSPPEALTCAPIYFISLYSISFFIYLHSLCRRDPVAAGGADVCSYIFHITLLHFFFFIFTFIMPAVPCRRRRHSRCAPFWVLVLLYISFHFTLFLFSYTFHFHNLQKYLLTVEIIIFSWSFIYNLVITSYSFMNSIKKGLHKQSLK